MCVCVCVGGHSCSIGIQEKKATLLTKNFMEETLRKVGLQGGQNFDSKNWGQ